MITPLLRTGLLAAALAAAPPTALAAQSTDAVVDRAVAAWEKVTSLRATFEQRVTNPLTGSTETARGEYQQQGRQRMSVRFTQPAGDRIVADGKALWLYLPSTAPRQVIRTAPGTRGTFDFTAQFLASPKTRYTIVDGGRATVDGRATRVLSLTPRSGKSPFERAKIWVDDRDGLIRQFEVIDPQGLTRRVRLSAMKVNGGVDATAFVFVPPRGVRVIEQ